MITSSCANPRYMKKREVIVRESYFDDRIYINGFLFYDDVVNSWEIIQSWSHHMNADSVFGLFRASLCKLQKNVIVEEGNLNIIDSSFHRNWTKRFDSEHTARIISLSKDKNRLQLVPLLKMTHGSRSGMYFASSGAVGGSRYLLRNDLDLIVYILRNDSIVYSRAAFFLGEEYPAYDLKDIQHTLTQQDWDELVALVMKDYVDRLQEGTEMNKLD